METHARKLLVIIGEGALEKNLVRDVGRFGAQGYTITDVRGGGGQGEREGSWENDRSIEMKIIADAAVAEQIAQHVLATYAPHYAIVMFTAEVGVFRPQKF
jgi:nitrogen regulatory protein P-II 2